MPGPAARLGDSTAHGGVIVMGFPTVLIGGMPAARVGDPHVCPMVTPAPVPIPHVGMPIASPGAPTVLIGGVPAATLGSIAPCVGPPDSIIMGCMTVLLGTGGGGGAGGGGGGGGGGAAANASAAAALFDKNETATKEEHWVEIEFVDKAGLPISGLPYTFEDSDGKKTTAVLRTDGTIRRDALKKEGKCTAELMTISAAKWSKSKAEVSETVKMSAKAEGFKANAPASILVMKRDLSGPDIVLEEIKTKVASNKIEAEWAFNYPEAMAVADSSQFSAPKYFFVAIAGKCVARSGMLEIEDFLEVLVQDEDGNAIGGQDYIVVFGDGTVRRGKLDGAGFAKEDGVPATHWSLTLPNMPGVRIESDH